jgi:hypothetical protein
MTEQFNRTDTIFRRLSGNMTSDSESWCLLISTLCGLYHKPRLKHVTETGTACYIEPNVNIVLLGGLQMGPRATDSLDGRACLSHQIYM